MTEPERAEIGPKKNKLRYFLQSEKNRIPFLALSLLKTSSRYLILSSFIFWEIWQNFLTILKLKYELKKVVNDQIKQFIL